MQAKITIKIEHGSNCEIFESCCKDGNYLEKLYKEFQNILFDCNKNTKEV